MAEGAIVAGRALVAEEGYDRVMGSSCGAIWRGNVAVLTRLPGGVSRACGLWQHRVMAHAARKQPKPPALPTESLLHSTALHHLSRYGATQAGLLRVLDRRISRWAASEAGDADGVSEARAAARRVVAELAASGAVDDAAFAQARSVSLRRAGKSARAIGAHLSSRGVPGEVADGLPKPGGEDEIAAAAIHMRRRRAGPFRTAAEKPETARRELASLARAGFGHQVAAAARRLSAEEAEALIIAYRAGL
jgi:regulatory protein